MTTTHGRRIADDYLKLVLEWPLRAIRTKAEYEKAGKVLNRLLGRAHPRLSSGERDYLDALVLLVEDYDRRHTRIIPTRRSPQEVLRYLAGQADVGPSRLGRILGTTHAMASLMLHGKRGISADAARRLANYFKVDPGIFI